MILCLCEGISDRDLKAAIRTGCSSVRELVSRTKAGSHCGQCACDLKRLVAEARERASVDDGESMALPLAAK